MGDMRSLINPALLSSNISEKSSLISKSASEKNGEDTSDQKKSS